ncbi:ABC transporter ATP-binding protein [Lysinibacillus sp. KU-BSD001]|uniref:ABC transporter ATP-binding protein n=1 Tax=Lysinibacillus sp. KU-BSD001 TaxID=3141328 RepID=UPI0036EE636B
MDAIQIRQLKKCYGKNQAVEDVTFSVQEGEIFGFVGPNGAGKSTTIRMLLNFIFPTGGHATIRGKDIVKESNEIKRFTGYVPSDVRFYGNMTVQDLIKVSNGFYDQAYMEETARLCELFDLDQTKKFDELSTGNKKKVAIVCALAVKPSILILDEPTNGLDPIIQKRLFVELKQQAEKGVAILLSSHNLSDVQEYCDRVGFIKQGKIVAITDLKEMGHPRKIITTWGGKEMLDQDMRLIEQKDEKRVYRYEGENHLVLLSLLQQVACDDFTIEHESLEDRFMHLYEKEAGQ